MSASGRAYSYTKERILDGRFAGGELISEGEIAGPTNLSRTPVREAFLQLEAEGLLRLYPKRGALVVPVSALEVHSVIETRLVVERFAIERVIEQAADLEPELAAAIERQRRVVDADDPRQFVEADREFHRIFVAAAGNPILLELLDSLRDRQSRMGIAAITRRARRREVILSEHQGLLEAIAAADAELAVARLTHHLDGTLEALREMWPARHQELQSGALR